MNTDNKYVRLHFHEKTLFFFISFFVFLIFVNSIVISIDNLATSINLSQKAAQISSKKEKQNELPKVPVQIGS